jgi:hypothetical protein
MGLAEVNALLHLVKYNAPRNRVRIRALISEAAVKLATMNKMFKRISSALLHISFSPIKDLTGDVFRFTVSGS